MQFVDFLPCLFERWAAAKPPSPAGAKATEVNQHGKQKETKQQQQFESEISFEQSFSLLFFVSSPTDKQSFWTRSANKRRRSSSNCKHAHCAQSRRGGHCKLQEWTSAKRKLLSRHGWTTGWMDGWRQIRRLVKEKHDWRRCALGFTGSNSSQLWRPPPSPLLSLHHRQLRGTVLESPRERGAGEQQWDLGRNWMLPFVSGSSR